MAYSQQTWTDGSAGGTPVDAARLNHMESGIYSASLGAGPGGWVDMKAAGATGNGTTDDTAAINNAISGSAVGSTIWFPPGTYLVSAPIVLYPSRTYLGAGGIVQQTTIKATSAVTGAILAGQGWNSNTLTACDNPIRVQGLNVVGPGKGTGTAHGIALTSFWCRIEDVFVQLTGGHGILLTDVTKGGAALTNSSATCSENTVFKCKFDSIGTDGLHVGNQAAFNTNQDGSLVDCLISGCNGYGVYMDQAGGWYLKGNHLYGMAQSGIVANSGFATTILGNYVEGDFGSANVSGQTYVGIGLTQGGGWGSTVVGNTVDTNQGGQLSTATAWRCFDIEANSGTSSTNQAVVVVSGNSATSTVASGTTKKAVAYNYATAGTASSFQVRTSGNFASGSGWLNAQVVDNTSNTQLNATGTTF